MPQTTAERAARWPGMDSEAITYLESQGFILGLDWNWRHPANRPLTEREEDAVLYLMEEWDFGIYIHRREEMEPDGHIRQEILEERGSHRRVLYTLLTGVAVCMVVLGALIFWNYPGRF